jgi:hypothetical protein
LSLRAEIHSAFDELAPSPFGLPERVLEAVVAERTSKPIRTWRVRARVPLSLVAVFVVVALVLGALLGGRLMSDWKATQQPVPGGIDTTQLHRLEAKALNLPLLQPGAACPGGPWDPATGWWGAAPVYVHSWISSGFIPLTATPWGLYGSFHAETDRSLQGPVVVRARNLYTGDMMVFVGQLAGGPAGGADNLNGQQVDQRLELVLDASHPPGTPSGGFYTWGFTAGLKADTSHHAPAGPATVGPGFCTGWQVDGRVGGHDFSETFEVPF